MSDAPENDRLVARLLREADCAAATGSAPMDRHPDEETLALFAVGGLLERERGELVNHLADCPACRATASAILSWPEFAQPAATEESSRPRAISRRKRFVAWSALAAAASVLLAVGLLLRVSDLGRTGMAATEANVYQRALALTEQQRFDEARVVVVEARRRGTESDRLRSIESQALRQMPGALALAHAGRLSDFGFEIGGVTARSALPAQAAGRAEEALSALTPATSNDDHVALNRGHALLSLQRPREALAEFQRVAGPSPRAPLARLGEGLASFAMADYPSAENAFRACLQLDPNQVAARINLAMTLGEEGKIELALAAWDEVLARPQSLSDEDRRSIVREVDELRQARERPPSPPANSGSPKKEQR